MTDEILYAPKASKKAKTADSESYFGVKGSFVVDEKSGRTINDMVADIFADNGSEMTHSEVAARGITLLRNTLRARKQAAGVKKS